MAKRGRPPKEKNVDDQIKAAIIDLCEHIHKGTLTQPEAMASKGIFDHYARITGKNQLADTHPTDLARLDQEPDLECEEEDLPGMHEA